MDIRGKTAIITGSGTGIGRALAVEFAKNGAKVVCCGRRIQKIRETADIINRQEGEAIAVKADVTNKGEVEQLVEAALDKFSTVDILFNNAGSFKAIGGVWETDPDEWWHDVSVNLRGVMLCCQQVLKVMIKKNSGVIINMNGGGAASPLPGGSAYGSSKAALMRFTETLARELEGEGYGIFVFGMGPGLVDTEMTRLQAESPLGMRWIPSTGECLRHGKTYKPEKCAAASIELVKIASRQLNGRNFSADTNFKAVERDLAKIVEEDLFVLRMRQRN